jgi:predicted nucleic acid-binding protein
MADRPLVVIDLNVILDVLQAREPFFEASARVLALAETGKIDGLVVAHSVTTLFYLVSKGGSASDARATLTSLLQFIRIVPVDHGTIEQALNLDYPDFEDAVQMVAALQSRADVLVTRNPKDYQPALLPVMQPIELLATF